MFDTTENSQYPDKNNLHMQTDQELHCLAKLFGEVASVQNFRHSLYCDINRIKLF